MTASAENKFILHIVRTSRAIASGRISLEILVVSYNDHLKVRCCPTWISMTLGSNRRQSFHSPVSSSFAIHSLLQQFQSRAFTQE